MDAHEWLTRYGAVLDNRSWERLFVEQVLARVRGLDFRHVTAQWGFTDLKGRSRRADFVIREEGVRIAIEVKGLKTPTGYRDWIADAEKALSLNLEGWVVMGFANSLFGYSTWIDGEPPQPLPDEAAACAATIEHEIRKSRELHELRKTRRMGVELKAEVEKLSQQVERERRERNRVMADLVDAEARNEELGRELDRVRAERQPQAEVAAELTQARAAMETLERQLAERDRRAPEQLDELQAMVKRLKQQGGENLKLALVGMVAISVAAIAAVFLMSQGGGSAVDDDDDTPTVLAAETADICAGLVPWDQAHACEGRTASIVGPVVGARFQEATNGQPTYLNVGEDFPHPDRVSVVIWGRCRGNFEVGPEATYLDRRVVVTAKVERFQDVIQIEVCRPGQIAIDGS